MRFCAPARPDSGSVDSTGSIHGAHRLADLARRGGRESNCSFLTKRVFSRAILPQAAYDGSSMPSPRRRPMDRHLCWAIGFGKMEPLGNLRQVAFSRSICLLLVSACACPQRNKTRFRIVHPLRTGTYNPHMEQRLPPGMAESGLEFVRRVYRQATLAGAAGVSRRLRKKGKSTIRR